jgi:serine/threonine-protein kinase
MGEVYLAQHPRLPRRDALKLLRADVSADDDYRARFEREADLASTLWHPHIVGVHDRGETDGRLWISMDFVDGVNAAELLAGRYPVGMPPATVASIATAIANALDYAHKQGLLHRDVKPANIMLTHVDEDGEQRILLADFGIARSVDDISGLTSTNMTVGTVAYAAPEQLMGDDIDGRADQYALAATAYHLLTGTPLFPHSNAAVVISRHLNAAPTRLTDIRGDLAVFDEAFATALAKDPKNRYQRCVDFAQALAAGASEPSLASDAAQTRRATVPAGPARAAPSGDAKPVESATRSRRRWLAPLVAGGVLVLVTASLLVWQPRRDSPAAVSVSVSTPPNSSLPSGPLTQQERTTSSATAPSTTVALPVVLPSEPPLDSGCHGLIVSHHDLEHPALGPMRIFLLDDPRKPVGPDAGCVAAVTARGTALPPIPVDVIDGFSFAAPATDATGNTFINYTTVRHGGVLVLVPTEVGFADIGWQYGGHYEGRYAFHYASLSGPGADGRYAIIDYTESCTPSCAEGTDSSEILTWNGTEYTA